MKKKKKRIAILPKKVRNNQWSDCEIASVLFAMNDTRRTVSLDRLNEQLFAEETEEEEEEEMDEDVVSDEEESDEESCLEDEEMHSEQVRTLWSLDFGPE